MGISTDPFYKNPFVMDMMRNKHANVLRVQLQTKFGAVPKWVDERLEAPSAAQLERWSKKILSAGTFEGVFGKRRPLL